MTSICTDKSNNIKFGHVFYSEITSSQEINRPNFIISLPILNVHTSNFGFYKITSLLIIFLYLVKRFSKYLYMTVLILSSFIFLFCCFQIALMFTKLDIWEGYAPGAHQACIPWAGPCETWTLTTLDDWA